MPNLQNRKVDMARREFAAKMVRIHLNESDRWHDQPVHEAILAKCLELGLARVTVFRGLEGFGASAVVHHARSWPFSRDAPIMVSVIDTASQVELLLPHLDSMVAEGVVAISDVHVVLYSASLQEET
jgi:PII-like signaling protein